MPRRVGLPGASELFRSTSSELAREADAARVTGTETARPTPIDAPPRRTPTPTPAPSPAPARADEQAKPAVEHTGRVRHDEKITVYVSSEELLALEHLRLQLRAEHGLAVDRGRIVRAAIASALASIGEQGADADVLRRLAAQT